MLVGGSFSTHSLLCQRSHPEHVLPIQESGGRMDPVEDYYRVESPRGKDCACSWELTTTGKGSGLRAAKSDTLSGLTFCCGYKQLRVKHFFQNKGFLSKTQFPHLAFYNCN